MRVSVLTVLVLAAFRPIGAQGRVIPRPCILPTPPACMDGRCRPVPIVRCPSDALVERTSSVARVALADRVLRWEIDETFVNRGARLAEADYIFPLPSGAAFQELQLEIDGELVSGETMSADRARGIYEEIVRRQRDPALVEWMGSGLLRARLFPLEPGRERHVVVRFQSVATREGDALRVDYTRPEAPRGTGPSWASDRGRLADDPARDDVRESGIAFTLTLERGEQYGAPFSPTHRLRERERDGRRIVSALGQASDLTILVPMRRATGASIATLASRAGDDSAGFVLITVTPPTTRARRVPRDVTFVLDVSGSMRGPKMEQARAAGHQLLETLSGEDRFRLVDFSTDVRTFRDSWASATPANIAAARRYLDDLRAEGSTNISGALEEALAGPTAADRLALTLFITDGEPTVGERDPARIAAVAARLRGSQRVFTFGVGADVSTVLVEQLAVEGRGTASFVRPGESVERAVSLLASRLGTPLVTDARVSVEGRGVRLAQLMPAGAQDIFAGQDLVLLARYTGSGPARLSVEGRAATGPVAWSADVRLPDRERGNAFVPRLWATQRIGWLSAERRRGGPSPELDAEIRELGTRYGIPTELTSYLVLEPGARVANGAPRDASGRAMRATDQADFSGKAAVATAPELRFEAARASAVRRDARSLAEAESVDGTMAESRRVGERLFTLHDGVWVDSRVNASLRLLRVRAYSRAWFDLVAPRVRGDDALSPVIPAQSGIHVRATMDPRVRGDAGRVRGDDGWDLLRRAFALGDRVRVAGRTVMIEVGATGVESLSAAELAALEDEWR